MLPTHLAQTSSSNFYPMSNSSYPPSTSPQFNSPSSNNILTRILGKGRITSFTVTTEPESSNSQQQSARDHDTTTTTTQPKSTKSQATPKPSRWRTPEFIFYEIIVAMAVGIMIWVPSDLSNEQNPNYNKFANHLKQGWILGRKRDDSDFQYRSFRDYVILLTIIMGVYLAISKIVSNLPSFSKREGYRPLTSTSTSKPSPNRLPFLLGFISIFVLALHGSNALKIISILGINYGLAKSFGGKQIAPVLIWSFNFGMLVAVHWNDGFGWSKFLPPLGMLDQYQGLLPRWQINFNITMLRLVSFGLDYHWAIQALTTNTTTQESDSPQLIARQRASISRHPSKYNFLNFLVYVLYPPLFIAGPIMTFNDFNSQMYRPLPFSKTPVIRYAIRVLSSMLVMELILHYMWVNAIKDARAWNGLNPLQLSMVGFWNLIVVWLKLLIPWRFFRLWALADGVDPPENMVRCMANNYSTLGFWRSWHRSYNLWIVRYIYIPLGGSKNPIPSTLLVFTFVALWHDLSFKLLTWGWLVTFFVLPEMIARKLIPEKKFGSTSWYRHLSAFGGVANVLMMMTANLVGFAIGVDGVKYMWDQILGSWEGVRFMVGTCFVLFTGVQVMFEYREEELRHGISRKC